MKNKIVILTIVWLCVLAIICIYSDSKAVQDNSYKISINRIHTRLTADNNENSRIIQGLDDATMGDIQLIEIADIQSIHKGDVDFLNQNMQKTKAVFKRIKNSDYWVKYTIGSENTSGISTKLLLLGMACGVCISIFAVLLYIQKSIIDPMKQLSTITKQLATGYIGEMNLQSKNSFVRDFVWSLDMLREQLSYERDKNAQLEKQRKTLVAGLSHDIKTPLSSVKNYAIALKEGVYDTAPEQSYALNVILEKTEVIDKLTKELLDASATAMSRIDINLRETYMADIDQRLDKLIHQKTDLKHMEYRKQALPLNLMVMADLERLLEVFDNVIENAMKYGDMQQISIAYSREENCQLIEIHNTGGNIPEGEIKHIFTSYYRGSNVGDKPGYGLGLYISKQIMKAMQGDIYIKNTDTGVRVIVVLRLAG